MSISLKKHTPPYFGRFMQIALLLCIPYAASYAGELSGNIAVEGRYFNHQGAFPSQQNNGGLSLSVLPEYKHYWDDDQNKFKFTFTPFYRWDGQDSERTHADIRQLDLVVSKEDWEFQLGIGKVYWGVTESQHLVDIINQTDGVEGTDGEDKLGQPMFHVSRLTENGSVDFFVLPYFRERTFPGAKGRFRSGLVVDTDAVTYESDDEERNIDYALRWTETFDEFDVGLHYFKGTSRQPTFNPIIKNEMPIALQPHYPLIKQIGLDLQYTGEATIWKFEGIKREGNSDSYTAFVGGFEHTFPAFDSGSEIGLLTEYHHDSRGEVPAAIFQNDLFIGARYALNDEVGSEFLAGAFIDLDNQSKSFRLEASRRLRKGFKLNIEGQVFTDIDLSDPLQAFAQDDFIQVELQKYF